MAHRFLPRWLIHALLLLMLFTLVTVSYGYWFLRESLPLLEGTVTSEYLQGSVTVERDTQGIPTIAGGQQGAGRTG